MAKTIGFYQNFRLDIQRLSNALCSIQQDPEMSHAALAQCMSVDLPVAEAFSSWLRHTGLVEPIPRKRPQKAIVHRLSPFGELAYQYDPILMDTGTQWILHYYLATRRGEASDAWHILVNKYLLKPISLQKRSLISSCVYETVYNLTQKIAPNYLLARMAPGNPISC